LILWRLNFQTGCLSWARPSGPLAARLGIEAVIELNDPAALWVALRHLAKAHGMQRLPGVPMWATRRLSKP